MDVIVIATEDGAVWNLTDLLGGSIGKVRENASNQFSINPEGHAFETMADILGVQVLTGHPLEAENVIRAKGEARRLETSFGFPRGDARRCVYAGHGCKRVTFRRPQPAAHGVALVIARDADQNGS